jgi:hypothetical protein
MKKAAIIAGAVFFLFTAVANAQTDTVPVQPAQPVQAEQPVQPVKKDQWNNPDPEKYKLQPMPEALSTEKIFPVIGKYNLTDKDGAATDVTISLDPTNKGIVWVEGLPQGKVKAFLRKSPGVYKIPTQNLEEVEAAVEVEADVEVKDAKAAKTAKAKAAEKAAKQLPEGVMIFDKDNNTLNVCIGCTYNNEDPAIAFAAPVEPEVAVEETKTKKATAKTKTKAKPVQTWKYSGNKVVETTAGVPAQ